MGRKGVDRVKYAQHTKVMINGQDVSNYVARVSLPRIPGEAQTVELTMFVDRLSVDENGLLTIRVDTTGE